MEPKQDQADFSDPTIGKPAALQATRKTPLWYRILLIVTVLFLCWAGWKFAHPTVKVELLPFNTTPPGWNGSYPYLTLSPYETGPESSRFKISIQNSAPTVRSDAPVNEFAVDLHSGTFVLRQTDLFISDSMPLSLTRTHRSREIYHNSFDIFAFGMSANHSYDISPTGTRFPYTYMDLNLEDGRAIYFPRISKGDGFADAVFRHEDTASEFYGAQIAWNGDGWTLKLANGSKLIFPENYKGKSFAQGAATEMLTASGQHIQLKRDQDRNLQQLISPSGHTITFQNDGAGRIIEAADDSGQTRKYSYDASGHLETVSDNKRLLYRFSYTQSFRMVNTDPYQIASIKDWRGTVLLRNTYNDDGTVSRQDLSDNSFYRYTYLYDNQFKIKETIVNGPFGEKHFYFKDGIPTAQE